MPEILFENMKAAFQILVWAQKCLKNAHVFEKVDFLFNSNIKWNIFSNIFGKKNEGFLRFIVLTRLII